MDLFHALGNDYSNSIWEALLPKEDEGYVKAYKYSIIYVHLLNYFLT